MVVSRDEQFELKRNALLREAAGAFAARGYHATSLDEVAASLGVTKAALYHYVRSKQEILFECHMRAMDLGDQALEHARAQPGSAFDRVVALARRYVELITGAMGRMAVLSEFDALDDASKEIVAARRDRWDRAMREMIAEGVVDGSIRPVDAKLAVFYLMGAINWMSRWYRPEGDASGARIAATFSELFAEGIRARSRADACPAGERVSPRESTDG